MDPMDADIVMSRENDAGDMDCNMEGCYPCWRWLSHFGRQGSANEHANVNSRRQRKAVTSALEWDKKYEAFLCERCQEHMKSTIMGTCVVLAGRFFP